MKRAISFITLMLLSTVINASSFQAFVKGFLDQYRMLNIPQLTYDYHEYFSSVSTLPSLEKQNDFFVQSRKELKSFQLNDLRENDKLDYTHINYEINNNLERIALEKKWVLSERKKPLGGLYALENYKEWYQYFIKKYTSVFITPEEVDAFGRQEVRKIQMKIDSIKRQIGIVENKQFYNYLKSSSFIITDKIDLVERFNRIDSIVRSRLKDFVAIESVPAVYPIEWADATVFTPPGMYLNKKHNAYGKDVFMYNFYNEQFNRRTIEWVYMHEAIPGHHLQSSFAKLNELQETFLYPGNFEGWACYVEYFGKQLGLFQDIYTELGKWEWDLVRSARLVLDVGIHYYGWSQEKALQYWKQTIPNQLDIAEREITRVTNWPCQALSYKIGADYIFKLRAQWINDTKHESNAQFHNWYLSNSNRPLVILKNHLSSCLSSVY